MENKFKHFVVLGFFILAGVIMGCTVDVHVYYPEKTVGTGDGPTEVATPAHLTKTVSNTSCTLSPPQHVDIPQQIPTSNPMFCWNAFGNTITSWSFILKDKNLNPVSGCNTPGYPTKVSTSTTSIVCSVNLVANDYYYGYLSHIYNGTTYTDVHPYKPQ